MAENAYKNRIRVTVLAEVNRIPRWRSAREIAVASRVTYAQTIFALDYLYNTAQVARYGRKSTSRWGPKSLDDERADEKSRNVAFLDEIFRNFTRRKV